MDNVPDNWDKKQIARQASFLQSTAWAEFQSQVGLKTHFLQGEGWSCLLLEKTNRIGSYLFSQYGPIVDSPEDLNNCLAYMKAYGKKNGAAWLSLEPVGPEPETLKKVLVDNKAVRSARHREPDLTRVIDLEMAQDDLLATISQSTRSIIRKNQREKFITFKTSTDPADIQIFIKMLNVVSKRKNVSFYSDEYFKKQARALMPAGMMHLEIAYMNNTPVASAVFHDYGQLSNYTYAGSLPQARQTSASGLLLWQGMLNAKARGMKKVDLYGIAPDNSPASHPWAGFTSFKAKFGGQVVSFAGTWDIPLDNRYRLYRAAHKARKIIKRH